MQWQDLLIEQKITKFSVILKISKNVWEFVFLKRIVAKFVWGSLGTSMNARPYN